MVDAVTGAATQTGVTASIADSTGTDKDMFLQLLVAQVRYQNPLEPMSNSEFMAQTAQFTMVEQITKLAEQQSELLAFQRATLATGMIGQVVTGVDEVAGRTITGIVDAVEYNLGDPQLVIASERIGLDEVVSSGSTLPGEAPVDPIESEAAPPDPPDLGPVERLEEADA